MNSLEFWFLFVSLLISNILHIWQNHNIYKKVKFIDWYVQNDLECLYNEVWELKRKERQRKE